MSPTNKILNGRFELSISDDEMRAVISPVHDPAILASEKDDLLRGIKAHRVVKGILDPFREEDGVLVVAEGQPALDGKDGWIECLFEADHTIHITEEHGHVDYRNLGTVQNTRKGESIAKRHLPARGENGYTITGRALQAKHGKVVDWKTGENVEPSTDGCQLIATIDGQPQNVGGKLSVHTGYVVEGDVDYSTGNIEFLGSVEVKGEIKPGFFVKAVGDVMIRGGIEDAVIESGGNVTIMGGVLGREHCSVKATGSILCFFAEHATFEAGGDVKVTNYLKSCHVVSGGSVIVDQGKGAIMGGETTARKSIRVKVAGAEMSGRIKLIILGKVEFMRKLEQLKKTLKDTEAQLEQFYKSVDRFVQAFPDAEVRAVKMSEVENFLSGKYEVANREMEELQAILKEQDDSRLYVLERIYGNTEVAISLYSTTVQQEHGPSELSVSAGRILLLPL